MAEIEKEGKSLGDIFRLIWQRKILVGILTGVTLILVVILILFWYNPNHTTYTSEFDLSFTGSEEGKFPNGELYNYKDILSKENLLAVKNSKEEYKNIDVEGLYKEDVFRISKNESRYVITLTGSKIRSTDTAADFIEDLVSLAVNNIKTNLVEIDYLDNLKAYEDYSIYKEAISYLINQSERLLAAYDELINSYGSSYTIKGKSLSSYRREANLAITDINLNYFLSEAETYLYVTDAAAKEDFHDYAEGRVKALLRQKNYNDKIIEEYQKMAVSSISYTGYTEQMDAIARENASILVELEILCTSTSADYATYTIKEATVAGSDFTQRVAAAYQTVDSLMQTLEDNVKTANLNSILFNFELNSIVSTSGAVNLILAAAGGLIVGLILGSAVALILEYWKEYKKKTIPAPEN